MISIVIVSHSSKVAEGVKELAEQVSQKRIKVFAAGGVDDQTIGTNVERIYEALLEATKDDGALVLLDLGSAILSAQMAVEMLPEDKQARVTLSEAPLVEGAIMASVEASLGHEIEKVKVAAEAATSMRKLP
ncbi:MAG: PTS-dependent dihydroxyacetone kinase phosphotransferase subunit DhaM [Chitinophagaceae bacterium]|nr:PTS-dependent dihydroxyacetone kinase phosphotransferase subunit DhaM [Anaerolineae bacterium]